MNKPPCVVPIQNVQLVDSGSNPSNINMKVDYQFLTNILSTSSILHFYDWAKSSATYGCLLKPERYLDMERVAEGGLDLAKRPTGGGIIFHHWDLAFSFLMPAAHPEFSLNTLENYAYVNSRVQRVIERFLGKKSTLLPTEPTPLDEASGHFCMAKPTKYDVMVGGRKVGGAAQRRTKQGFLHQATLSLIPPNFELLNSYLLPGTEVVKAMNQNTFVLAPNAIASDLPELRSEIRALLKEEFGAV